MLTFICGFATCIVAEIVAAFTWAVVHTVRRVRNEQK